MKFIVYLMVAIFYFAPTFAAVINNKSFREMFVIFLANILFGWTLIGWVILAWKATRSPQKQY